MKIKLHRNYTSADGVSLKAGEYDASDPRLKGKASYLVETDHAVIIEDTPTDEQDATDTEQSAEPTDEAALRELYETLSGEKADGRWSLETLQEKVNELA